MRWPGKGSVVGQLWCSMLTFKKQQSHQLAISKVHRSRDSFIARMPRNLKEMGYETRIS